MGKRKAVKGTKASGGDKVPFQMRFDRDVYAGIVKLAESAEVSVNQLVQGLARWAVKHGQAGEAAREEGGRLVVRPQAGCVFIGRASQEVWHDEDGNKTSWDAGEIKCQLDFTERHVIREP